MLNMLRKRAQSTIIQIIVLVIAIVFVFWGVGSNLGNKRNSLATVMAFPLKLMFAEYTPSSTRTVSPSDAALIAACIDDRSAGTRMICALRFVIKKHKISEVIIVFMAVSSLSFISKVFIKFLILKINTEKAKSILYI